MSTSLYEKIFLHGCGFHGSRRQTIVPIHETFDGLLTIRLHLLVVMDARLIYSVGGT